MSHSKPAVATSVTRTGPKAPSAGAKLRTCSAGAAGSTSKTDGSKQETRPNSGPSSRSAPNSAGKRSCGSAGSSGSSSRSGSGKLSDRLNPKTVDPFSSTSKNKSAFATLYSNGGIPCRLVHGSVKHKLAWNSAPEDVPFDPVLIALAEGIRETVHPYMFVAREGFKELMRVPSAGERAIPLLSKLVPPIRMAISSTDDCVFEAGLDSIVQLSAAVGPSLDAHLKTLLVSVGKRSMEKKHREKIIKSLQHLEKNGGKEALLSIKAKVPTYQSVVT